MSASNPELDPAAPPSSYDRMNSSFCRCDACLIPPGARHAHRKLIKNVSIFTGTSAELITGHNVVVEGHTIASIAPAGIPIMDGEGGFIDEEGFDQVIDGRGGFLTPGLVDVHWHTMMALDLPTLFGSTREYIAAIALVEAKKILRRGVTTLRDAAGEVFGIKQAIDEGKIEGPRIYPSGSMMSQYSGHGDFRSNRHMPKEWGGPSLCPAEEIGLSLLCTGVDQVLAGSRHNLFRGATQVKIAITGGVMSFTDPLYVNEFFEEEIRAAVRAADDYGTYVMAHCHSSAGAQRALKAGVKSFDHLSCVDEETIKMLADANAVGSVQVLTAANIAENFPKGDPRQVKAQMAVDNMTKVFEYSRKYGFMLAWGTDLLNSEEAREKQLDDLVMRTKFGFTSAELMIQATGNGGRTVSMCGKRNPYGKLGVIEVGAMADILIYSKNPLEDINVLADHEETLKLIIKDGDIVKNNLCCK